MFLGYGFVIPAVTPCGGSDVICVGRLLFTPINKHTSSCLPARQGPPPTAVSCRTHSSLHACLLLLVFHRLWVFPGVREKVCRVPAHFGECGKMFPWLSRCNPCRMPGFVGVLWELTAPLQLFSCCGRLGVIPVCCERLLSLPSGFACKNVCNVAVLSCMTAAQHSTWRGQCHTVLRS